MWRIKFDGSCSRNDRHCCEQQKCMNLSPAHGGSEGGIITSYYKFLASSWWKNTIICSFFFLFQYGNEHQKHLMVVIVNKSLKFSKFSKDTGCNLQTLRVLAKWKLKNLAFPLTIPTTHSQVVFLSENSKKKQRMLKLWLLLKKRVHCSFCNYLFQY